jgi:integrase
MPDFAALLRRIPPGARHGIVFLIEGPDGKPLSPKQAIRSVPAFGSEAKVMTNVAEKKHATAHDYRRAFATRWARRGLTPIELQKVMRHRHIETTLSYYTHLDAEDMASDFAGTFGQGPLQGPPAITQNPTKTQRTKKPR